MNLFRLALLTGAGALSLAATQASAADYIISGVGSGSLNGATFTNKTFTFTLTGNPTSSTGVDPLTSAKLLIAGLGEVSLQISTRLRESGTTVYLSKGSGGADLFSMFFVSAPDLAANNAGMQALFASPTNAFANIGTTGGLLTFLSADQVTFSGSLAAPVPEPASWTMLIAGFGLVGAAMRRRTSRVTVRYA